MERFDIEKLNKAMIYVDRIANGKNPINNLPVEDDYVLNDPNVIRCMFFVKDVLNAVKENNGAVNDKATRRKQPREAFPIERLQGFKGREQMTITPFVKILNDGLDKNVIEVLKVRTITDWLKSKGYLATEYNQKLNKDVTISTEKGQAAGITSSFRTSSNGTEYCRVEYNAEAQEMIVEHMAEILNADMIREE